MYVCKNHVMKRITLIFCLFIYSICAYAQLDKKSTPIKLELKSKTTTDIPDNFSTDLPSLEFKSSINNKDDNYLKKYSILNKKEPTKSFLEPKDDFKNPGDEVKDRLNDKSSVDTYACEDCIILGSFKLNSKFVRIFCWDYQEPDEDLISILHNKDEKAKNFMITRGGKDVILELKEGQNIIDFIALNEGLQSPNTAAFIVYDDVGNIITTSYWSLLTGQTARIAIIKQ